jgi:uncharacterized protein with HEPN domain
MPQRDDLVYVSDMVEYGAYACEFVEGREASDLFVDRQLAFSLVRALTVLGEAAAQVSREWRVEHAEIPWREIVGMRNILVHGYTRVDYELLWEVATKQLPPLIVQLRTILEQEDDD